MAVVKRALEVVYWRDAHHDTDGDPDYRDYIVKTAGWVNEKCDHAGDLFLCITGEQTPNGPRSVTHIPQGMVIRRDAYVIV